VPANANSSSAHTIPVHVTRETVGGRARLGKSAGRTVAANPRGCDFSAAELPSDLPIDHRGKAANFTSLSGLARIVYRKILQVTSDANAGNRKVGPLFQRERA